MHSGEVIIVQGLWVCKLG